MAAQTLSIAQANLKMSLWQVDADSMSSNELYVWLDECNLPHEVIMRLRDLSTYTKKAGSKIFAVGKIILIKIIEFIKANPGLVAGIGIGAAISAYITGFITSIPFLGQLLTPLAIALGITVTAISAIAGHRVDKRKQGKQVNGGILGIAEDVIETALTFSQLVIDVFSIIFKNVIGA